MTCVSNLKIKPLTLSQLIQMAQELGIEIGKYKTTVQNPEELAALTYTLGLMALTVKGLQIAQKAKA